MSSLTTRRSAAFALSLFAAAGLLAVAGAAQAQEQTDGQWHGGLSAGGAFSSGNSDTKTLSSSTELTRATQADKYTLYGNANYGRSTIAGTRTTTADQLRLGGRYDYNLNKDVFLFGGLEGESNKIAGIVSRYALNAGAGYKLLQDSSNSLSVFGGAGYTTNRYTDDRKGESATLLIGEESKHKLSQTTTFTQRLAFQPGHREVGNLATFDAGLATQISGAWTLNTGVNVRHTTLVEPGRKATDSLLTVGFGYKF